jgi:peptidyl-prolyl cis-trans isomerase B (cyclophilin B)
MPNRRTRDRQLAKLAARRAAERHRKRRQRLAAISVASALFLGAMVFLLVVFVGGKTTKPAAAPTPTATASPSASASPTPAGVACGGKVPKAASVKKPSFDKPPKKTIDAKRTYVLDMKTSCGTIKIQLLPKVAPNTVNSLVFLAEQGFFDGQLFHRTVQGFVIQGGDPNTVNDPAKAGQGGPGYSTVDPPPAGAKYPAGTVAMAKTQAEAPGTAGSQFFIVTGKDADAALAPGGKGQYAIVGKVVAGMDVATKIEQLPRAGGTTDGRPAQDVYIERVTVRIS